MRKREREREREREGEKVIILSAPSTPSVIVCGPPISRQMAATLFPADGQFHFHKRKNKLPFLELGWLQVIFGSFVK